MMMSNQEAAAYLGIKPDTLRKWRVRCMGPAYHRYGAGRTFYRKEDLDEWLKDKRHQNTTEEFAHV